MTSTHLDKPPTTPSGSSSLKLLEEGTAFFQLADAHATEAPGAERLDVIVIGGGQSGLSVGYHLARHGIRFVILDERPRTGDVWRQRWDSLRLFTPARFDGLDGMPFPRSGDHFPTKDEMGDYLEAYATRFELPVRTGVSVDRVYRDGERYVVESGHRVFEADNVIVATGAHRTPKAPAYAAELDQRLTQLHSAEYRNPGQLRGGDVLVVGLGNSGAEIAYELARTHRVWQAGEPSGEIPVRHGSFPARIVLPVIRFLGTRVLTVRTPIGRKLRPKLSVMATPLIRVKARDLSDAGVERVPRVAGVRAGLPLLEDGRVLDVENVIWCTGFRHEFSWIDLPVFSAGGQPLHERGVVPSSPGLYFVGLVFQYAAASDVLPGTARDAAYIAEQVARSATPARRSAEPGLERALELP